MRSSEVGSAQCRSSKASTTGCVRAPARTQAVIAANCRRRNSSGAVSVRGPPARGYRPAARAGAHIRLGRGRSAAECSRGRRGAVRRAASAPNRWRPHSAIGCSGVFCKSCDDDHSTQVCGVSPSRARNSSISRDLPMPGSPTIWTNWPSPFVARSQRRLRRSSSSSRPTRGVSARAPPRRPPPLARTMR